MIAGRGAGNHDHRAFILWIFHLLLFCYSLIWLRLDNLLAVCATPLLFHLLPVVGKLVQIPRLISLTLLVNSSEEGHEPFLNMHVLGLRFFLSTDNWVVLVEYQEVAKLSLLQLKRHDVFLKFELAGDWLRYDIPLLLLLLLLLWLLLIWILVHPSARIRLLLLNQLLVVQNCDRMVVVRANKRHNWWYFRILWRWQVKLELNRSQCFIGWESIDDFLVEGAHTSSTRHDPLFLTSPLWSRLRVLLSDSIVINGILAENVVVGS